jgi:hypothetical protein
MAGASRRPEPRSRTREWRWPNTRARTREWRYFFPNNLSNSALTLSTSAVLGAM